MAMTSVAMWDVAMMMRGRGSATRALLLRRKFDNLSAICSIMALAAIIYYAIHNYEQHASPRAPQ